MSAMADEAIHIGAAPAAESYLQQDRIIAAAREIGRAGDSSGLRVSERERIVRRAV